MLVSWYIGMKCKILSWTPYLMVSGAWKKTEYSIFFLVVLFLVNFVVVIEIQVFMALSS